MTVLRCSEFKHAVGLGNQDFLMFGSRCQLDPSCVFLSVDGVKVDCYDQTKRKISSTRLKCFQIECAPVFAVSSVFVAERL